MWIKTVYRNLTYDGKETIGFWREQRFKKKEDVLDPVLDTYHKYYGNHMLGHGEFSLQTYKVSRPNDVQLDEDTADSYRRIEALKKQIAAEEQNIEENERLKKIEYEENLWFEDTYGGIPTDEELLASGWTQEQIDEAKNDIK